MKDFKSRDGVTHASLPIPTGAVPEIVVFDDLDTQGNADHFALLFPAQSGGDPPTVRIHSECVTGDVLGSLRCDCGNQLREAVDMFSRQGGVLLYLRQEGRGIGLQAKIKAYVLQETGIDTFEANSRLGHPEDARTYAVAAQMLKRMGIEKIRLHTRNPEKARSLEELGIQVVERVPTQIYSNPHNERYLASKEQRAQQLDREPP